MYFWQLYKGITDKELHMLNIYNLMSLGSLLQGISQPRDQTQVSCTAGRFFTSWATTEAQEYSPVDFPDPGIEPGFPVWTHARTHNTMTTIKVTDIPNTSQHFLMLLNFCFLW